MCTHGRALSHAIHVSCVHVETALKRLWSARIYHIWHDWGFLYIFQKVWPKEPSRVKRWLLIQLFYWIFLLKTQDTIITVFSHHGENSATDCHFYFFRYMMNKLQQSSNHPMYTSYKNIHKEHIASK
jgi:hypothetical protein